MRPILAYSCLVSLMATDVCAGPVFDAAKTGDTEALVRILGDGADANEPNVIAPLQIAAFNGHVDALQILIDQGADIEAESTMIGTALHAAAHKGYAEAIAVLLDAGANPNSRNKDQFTPLMIASSIGHARAAAALIAGAADVDAIGMARTNGTGGYGNVNALHLAKWKGHSEVADVLVEAGAGPKPPLDASSLIDSANADLGLELAKQRCDQCHKIESEDEVITRETHNLSLVGVYGRPIGSRDDFEYSEALRQFGGTWTTDMLYSFAVDAMLTIPGTRMNWHDGWSDEEVAHIVAYFKLMAE